MSTLKPEFGLVRYGQLAPLQIREQDMTMMVAGH
jgi:hypothetical protein